MRYTLRFFRPVARDALLAEANIVAVRLLGCDTAVTEAGLRCRHNSIFSQVSMSPSNPGAEHRLHRRLHGERGRADRRRLPSTKEFNLRNTNQSGDADIRAAYGTPTDRPMVGDRR